MEARQSRCVHCWNWGGESNPHRHPLPKDGLSLLKKASIAGERRRRTGIGRGRGLLEPLYRRVADGRARRVHRPARLPWAVDNTQGDKLPDLRALASCPAMLAVFFGSRFNRSIGDVSRPGHGSPRRGVVLGRCAMRELPYGRPVHFGHFLSPARQERLGREGSRLS